MRLIDELMRVLPFCPSARAAEMARYAIRRWRSIERRHDASDLDARTRDLAKGLLAEFDRDRMDEPGWNRWAATACAPVLHSSTGGSDSP